MAKYFNILRNLKELGVNADGVTGDIGQTESQGPMTCGFFRLDNPGSVPYNYSFEEYKIVMEGEMTVKDDKGNEFTAKKGDMFYFENGDNVTFETNISGATFYVAQRKKE